MILLSISLILSCNPPKLTRIYALQTHIFPLFYEAEIASIRRLFVLLFLLEYIIPGDGCTTYVSLKLNSSFFVVLS